MRIPLSSPSITDIERRAVLSVLDTTTLSIGPHLEQFERAFCELTGSAYAVAVNSGTSALHLAIKAANIGPGDEVITTPFSFVASANCILFEGATPVFVDIDERTYNLNVDLLPAAVSARTRAILPVHVFGRPCEMSVITTLARQNGLRIIEDACEAIGARVAGRHVGLSGDAGVFAFYPNKQITTGEGGMIITNTAESAQLYRSLRNQGRSQGAAWLVHDRLGYNYRLSEINCALGWAQVGRLPEILRKRAAAAALYSGILADSVPEVVPPAAVESGTEMSWFVYVVRLADEFTRAHRDAILTHLRSRGIGCSNYFSPIHLQPFYRKQFGFAPGDFPVTERVADRTIALPFFTDIGPDAIAEVCSALREAVDTVLTGGHVLAQAGA